MGRIVKHIILVTKPGAKNHPGAWYVPEGTLEDDDTLLYYKRHTPLFLNGKAKEGRSLDLQSGWKDNDPSRWRVNVGEAGLVFIQTIAYEEEEDNGTD